MNNILFNLLNISNLIYAYPPQDVFLYLHWYNRNIRLVHDPEMIQTINKGIVVFKDRFKVLIESKLRTDPLWCFKDVCIGSVIPLKQEPQTPTDPEGLA